MYRISPRPEHRREERERERDFVCILFANTVVLLIYSVLHADRVTGGHGERTTWAKQFVIDKLGRAVQCFGGHYELAINQ